MKKSKEIALSCLGMRARTLSRSLTRLYDDALRPHGIKSTQFNILVALDAYGPLSPGEVVTNLALEKSSLSRAADTMIARHWLRSDNLGGRATQLSATAEGKALIERAFSDWQSAQSKALEMVGAEGAQSLRMAARFPAD